MKSLAIFVAALSFCGQVQAAETAAFLKITPGARPIGMGQAFTAVADDLNSLSWNPAGLSRIGRREAAFTHAELFADTQFDFAGYSQPMGGNQVAIGYSRLSQGKIGGRGEDRKETGSFTAADSALQIAVSRPLSAVSGGRWGVSGKLLESRIGDTSARGIAMDMGYQQALTLQGRPVTLGLAVMNMGPGIKYQQETSALPLTVSGGVAVPILSTVLISADYRYRPDSADSVGVGTEYAVMPALALRAGFSPAATKDTSTFGGGGLGLGFGLKVGKARFDYSFMPAGILGSAQRLSLSSRF